MINLRIDNLKEASTEIYTSFYYKFYVQNSY